MALRSLTWLPTQLGPGSVASEDSGSPELDGGLTVLGQWSQANKVIAMAAKSLHVADIGLLEQGDFPHGISLPLTRCVGGVASTMGFSRNGSGVYLRDKVPFGRAGQGVAGGFHCLSAGLVGAIRV